MTQLTLPKGGGALQALGETFQSNAFTGTASLSIPIHTSPCRGPELSISVDYSSGAGNGPFGLGFALDLPNISRKTSKGLPHYDESDTYLLANADDLVLIEGSQDDKQVDGAAYRVIAYWPRTEGLFASIERWIDQQTEISHWRVVGRDNRTSLFGTTESTRVFDPQRPANIFQWLLAETFDAEGNRIVYHYTSENSDNLPAALYELNRGHTANKYVQRITYGNALPFQEGQDTAPEWHFEVVFDYGEYDLDGINPTPLRPVRAWAARQDPFSTYHAGFEIRSHRLCRSALLFHRFEELGSEPVLVHATRFHYDESPTVTLLRAVESTGYRYENGSYQSRSLPRLEFGYTDFQPAAGRFDLLEEHNRIPPSLNSTPNHQLVDLFGEGVPGLLYSDGHAAIYWEPQGEDDGQGGPGVRYAQPQALPTLPIHASRQPMHPRLIDLTGNGQLDLVVSTATGAGYYQANPDRSWAHYRALPAFPTDFLNPDSYMVDVTGDGLADVLLIEPDKILVYASLRDGGFGPALVRVRENGVPFPNRDAPDQVVLFADMFGTGAQHLVRISNGKVECWPNLGYGRFGAPVLLANAPHFGAELNPARLFLADLDGSGTVDLIYLHPDRAEIFFNQSGNSFADPVELRLPGAWDRLDQIEFADVYGNGTACLVFTEPQPQPRHWCYDFSQGRKPYLLDQIDNNLGARSTIAYCSSTQFYLADKRRGAPWLDHLPFPVQVVERVESCDLIAQNRLVSTYAYHHGCYDGEERVFRGFGLVEQQDAERLSADAGPTDVPPVLTKTWFHTGTFLRDGVLSRQYESEYFWEPQTRRMADSIFEHDAQAGANDWREACRALAGAVLREEIYAPTAPTAMPEQNPAAPYSVTETNYCVRMLQPRIGNSPGVHFIYPRETLSYSYERNPADPRIQHEFVVNVDKYGNVLETCHVAYPRRDIPDAYPEQQQLRVTATAATVINLDRTRDARAGAYLLGLPCEERTFEIGGLAAPQGGYLSFEQIKRHLEAARANQIAFEQPLSGTAPQARLLQWQRHYYWNADQTAALPLSQAAAHALAHHSQAAVFSPAQLQQVFGDKVGGELLQGAGGYVLQDGYWWNPGAIAHYYGAADFYLSWKTTDPFGAETVISYDAHRLLPQTITDALGNVTRADRLDYHTLLPAKLIDINDNISEARFDPLGLVIATSTYGTEDGKPKGDASLEQYTPRTEASLQAILQNPAQYLQQATGYFFYDPFAWQNDRQPPYALSLLRETHASDLAPGAATRMHVGIAYSDGFGRAVQSKGLVEPGQAFLRDADGSLRRDPAGMPIEGPVDQRWLVSGRTVYNNKGAAVKQYEPFYSATASYESERELAEYGVTPVLHYDVLLRVVRVDTPKGFFSKVEFTPWQETHYDGNDTIKDSAYYQQLMAAYPAQPTEAQKYDRDALDKAAAFYNTPQIAVFDSAGNPFLSIQDNLGRVPEDAFKDIVAGPSASNALWELLIDQGYLSRDRDDPESAWVTGAFQPYRAGFNARFIAGLPDAHKPSGEALVDLLRQSCLTAHQTYDIQGRAIESADPRLYYANITQGTAYYNFRHVYAMDGAALAADSADAGLNLSLDNAAGSFSWNRSARNFDQLIAYDLLQRPVSIRVKGIKNDGTVATDNLVETFVYGEGQPRAKDLNLRGKLYRRQDQSGTIVNSRYSLHGTLLETSRQLAQDYKDYISWDKAVPMDAERYTSSVALNALQQVIAATTPDGAVTLNSYNQAGALDQVAVRLKDGTRQPIVDHIEYNAKGQRVAIAYANGATTAYTYEPTTMRLVRLYTTRPGRDGQGKPRQAVLQDIAYTYDPVGNITRTYDNTYQTVFYNNQKVDPLSDYTYDALYRLVKASGRQHPGINATTERNNQAEGSFKHSRYLPLPGDSAKLENYYQSYTYDEAGNLVRIAHTASNSWTRRQMIMPDSNRLKTIHPSDAASAQAVAYDRSGNQAQLDINSSVGLTWSCCETLRKAAIIQRPNEPDDSDYYTYDGDELRTRKVSERLSGGGAVIQKEEKRYLGGYEVKLIQNGQTTILKRHTLRVMDDQTCVAIIHTWEQDDTKREVDSAGTRRLRYQLGDHLGSSALELSEDAEIISYEEYYPYGGTALIAGRIQREVKLKEYRYSGKERDDATGLYYYGARYYAPWLCRWLSADPAGAVDGLNLYVFVSGNPINYNDQHGEMSQSAYHSFDIFNAQGLGDSNPNKRRRVLGATPSQVPGSHMSVATEVMATAVEHISSRAHYENHQVMDPFHGTGTKRSMNYLTPAGSVVMDTLVPPHDILTYLKTHKGIPQNVTTIDGIHGSNSRDSSHRNPVQMPEPPGIFQYGIHSRSGGAIRALYALLAQAYALRDLNPASPMHLSGDLNQTATAVQAEITAIELNIPARAGQLRVVAPPNNTQINRATGNMRRLDFTITNIHPNDITITVDQPSGRGESRTSDHGKLRVTLKKKPRVGAMGGPWPGPSPEPPP